MINLKRHDDWEERLSVYLDRVADEPFKWGSHDCALFAADCVLAMTGADPAEAYRGKYDTARGAAEALREHGAGTLLKTLRATFETEISVHFAQRGDVVNYIFNGQVMEVYDASEGSRDIAHRGWTTLVPGRRRRLTSTWRITWANGIEQRAHSDLFFIGMRGDGVALYTPGIDRYIEVGANGWGGGSWAKHSYEVNDDDLIAAGCSHVRGLHRFVARAGQNFQILSLTLEDVTSEAASSAAASAAATSAASAAASNDQAGQRASAAQEERVRAETARGQAEIYRGDAATSASNAAGSAAAAATSQRVAAAAGAARGLTPNGMFDAGTEGWVTSGPMTFGNWYQGPGYEVINAYGTLHMNKRIPVDTSRTYRLNAKVVNHGPQAAMVYVGMECYNAQGQHLGNVYMPNFVFSGSTYMPPYTVHAASNEFTGQSGTPPIFGHVGFFPTGTVVVQPIALLNYPSPNPVEANLQINWLYLEDITEEKNARNQASAAQSYAAAASASEAAASSSASLAASVSGGAINKNSNFADFPPGNGVIPPYWASWEGNGIRAYGNGDPGTPGNGLQVEGSPWSFYQDTATPRYGGTYGNNNTGFFQDVPGGQGYYVVSASVQLRYGTGMGGSGILMYGLDAYGSVVASDTLNFANEPDINGRVLGTNVQPGTETFRFSKLMRLNDPRVATVRIYAMTNWDGFPGTWAAGRQAKGMSWLRAGYRAASSAEIKTGKIDTLEASVSQQAGVIASLSGKTAAYWGVDVVAGGRARLKAYADGYGSAVDIGADAVFLGNNRTFAVTDGRATVAGDLYVEGGNLIIRGATHMTVQGVGFGAAGEFVEWYGPIMPVNQCNRTNGLSWKTRSGAQRISSFQTGVLVSGNTNPSLGSSVSVTTGQIGSNGGQIQATASWFWRSVENPTWPATHQGYQGFMDYVASIGATSPDGGYSYNTNQMVNVAGGDNTLVLRKNGTIVATTSGNLRSFSFYGVAPVIGDSAPGNGTITEVSTLNITYTDPVLSTASRSFEATLTRGGAWTLPTQQTLTVATSE